MLVKVLTATIHDVVPIVIATVFWTCVRWVTEGYNSVHKMQKLATPLDGVAFLSSVTGRENKDDISKN